MKRQDFESILFKESIKALHMLCKGSEDIITFEESLEHFGRFRPIIENIQVMKYEFNEKNNCEITFVFSPEYMFGNDSIAICHYLNYLVWKLTLPIFNWSDENIEDEGVSLWLSRGTIVIVKNDFPLEIINDLSYKEFTETFVKNSQ